MIKGIEFSEETVEGWAKKAGVSFEKPKFEPRTVHLHCFKVSVSGKHVVIQTAAAYTSEGCRQTPKEVDEFISDLQAAKAFLEANS
jgi:hypothetical protein